MVERIYRVGVGTWAFAPSELLKPRLVRGRPSGRSLEIQRLVVRLNISLHMVNQDIKDIDEAMRFTPKEE